MVRIVVEQNLDELFGIAENILLLSTEQSELSRGVLSRLLHNRLKEIAENLESSCLEVAEKYEVKLD